MSQKPRESARAKILRAAEELTGENGAGNLSLDAVAARAGISKGGLLYHFPSKAKLLEALVESFVEKFDEELAARVGNSGKGQGPAQGAPQGNVGAAVLDIFVEERKCHRPPSSGVLAALAENPDFLAPIRKHQRALLDRIQNTARDRTQATIVFLALQGIRSQDLFAVQPLDSDELDAVTARLREMVSE